MLAQQPKFDQEFWHWYYQDGINKWPTRVLHIFLKDIKNDLSNTLVVDVGAGAGKDAQEFIEHGAKVVGIDGNPLAYEYAVKQLQPEIRQNLTRETQLLEDLHIPKNQIVFSSKTLGFVQPDHFSSMMDRIKESIESGGYFIGNFFGEKCDIKNALKLNEEEVRALFPDFTINYIEEKGGRIINRRTQNEEYRHFRNIIAQKR